jgi:hypothetical protein
MKPAPRNACVAVKWSARSVFSRRRCQAAWWISSARWTTCLSARNLCRTLFPERRHPLGAAESAGGGFDHLDDMHQAFLQQNFDLPPGSVPCHIVNSSEAFVQLRASGHHLLHDPASAD